MIAHLRGTVLEKHPNQVIVEAAGVGYDVSIPVSTFTLLPEVNAEVRLRIHTQVREDAISLFGFYTIEEKIVFEKLISVSGIGPKLAISVLSGLPVDRLVGAIRGGDLNSLTKIPGVGKKTGERMLLELRDKLDGIAGSVVSPSGAFPREAAPSALQQDVVSALLNLGCTRPAAEAAVKKALGFGVPEEFELLFRKSLELVR